jgi:hypothetical protein
VQVPAAGLEDHGHLVENARFATYE